MTDKIVEFSIVMEMVIPLTEELKILVKNDPDQYAVVGHIIEEFDDAIDVYTEGIERSYIDGAGREHIMDKDILYCSACDNELPISNFSKTKSSATGHQGFCKKCITERYK